MKRVLSLVSHPVSIGMIGFIVGFIAAYSIPGFAQSGVRRLADEDRGAGRPPVERRGPAMGQPGIPEGERRSNLGSPSEPMGERREPRFEGVPIPPVDIRWGSERRSENLFGVPRGETGGQPREDESFRASPEVREDQGDVHEQEDSDRYEQEQQKQEERQKQEEDRRKKEEQRMLEQMKRGMQQSVKGLASMKKQFDKWESKSVKLPSECHEAYTQAKTLVDAILKAESFEQIEELSPEDMREYIDTMQDCRQTGERLARLPQMLKRIDSEIKNLEKAWTRAKKNVPDDAQDAVSDGNAALQAIKQARTKLNEAIKSGEIDDIEEVLEDEIYGKFDDVRSQIQRLGAASNAKKFVAEYTRQMKTARTYVERLRKRGKDVKELEDILARAEQKYQGIKALKLGGEEYYEAVQELAEIGQEFAEQTSSEEDFGAQLDGTNKK